MNETGIYFIVIHKRNDSLGICINIIYFQFVGSDNVSKYIIIYFVIAINITKKERKIDFKGKVLLSNYNRETFNGILLPYEGLMIID